MYEAGEVDYLVATDAIGMGLNMAIDHVAFSALGKFDGHSMRRLRADEIGQIAGRAGRHMSDGTFGPTAELAPFEPDLVRALEAHQFENLRYLNWRSIDLDFASLDALKRSLEAPPPSHLLKRARAADDFLALTATMADPEIRDIAATPDKVRLLWDVCQVPDFGRDMHDGHRRLVARLFRFLVAGGVVPDQFVARAVARLDRTDGDIDTLIGRIAHTRTWTYVSHRRDWLGDADGWQERARQLEDKLSDALHERLTQRFVDRKTAVLVKRLREGKELIAAVTRDRQVVVEGETVGRLEGFRFVPTDDEVATSSHLMASANRAVRDAFDRELSTFEAAGAAAFRLDPATGDVTWDGTAIARLAAGADVLGPRIDVMPSELLDAVARERVRRRLASWIDGYLRELVGPLFALRDAPLAGAARGIAYRIVEGMGCAAADGIAGEVRKLADADRKALAQLGVRSGVETVYLPAMLKGRVRPLKALLWSLMHETGSAPLTMNALPNGGATSLARDPARSDGWYLALGFRPAGPLAIRADLLERLLAEVRRSTREGPMSVKAEMLTSIGATPEAFAEALRAFAYAVSAGETGLLVERRKQPRRGRSGRRRGATAPASDGAGRSDAVASGAGKPRKKAANAFAGKSAARERGDDRRERPRYDPDSPFAKLAELKFGNG
jgi:ATP-dependent RNA helicase SUPV3L1/SUV3